MKSYDKNKESSYLKYWDVNNLYGWAIFQKLPLGGLTLVEEAFQFNEYFIKIYNDDRDIFLKLMLNILKINRIFTMIYPFCLKE